MKTVKRTLMVACVALLTGTASVATAQFAPKPLGPLEMTSEPGTQLFTTRHQGRFNGKQVKYRAEVAQTIVKDAQGNPAASMFSTAYIAEGVKDPAARPVLFAFNGGPGASAAFLHLGALGPRILADHKPDGALVDNPQSPLDVVDLVFLDPPGTGHGRILPEADPTQFASVDGDSEAMAQVVINWLRKQGRLSSPVYLLGESYGTMRAVAMARDLRRGTPSVAVAGLMLTGNSLGYFQKGQMPDILYAANALPYMASVAWYHGKIDRTQTWTQAVDKARDFARTDYIAALMQGYRLDPAERERILEKLPAIIGIPAENIRRTGGIVPKDFKAELLADQGLLVDGNDGRKTHPAASFHRATQFTGMVQGFASAVEIYEARELKVGGLEAFKSFNPALLANWNYYTAGAMALDVTLAQEMKASTDLRVMLVQGRFDTLTTIGNSEYIMRQADLDPARYSIAYYDGGHNLLPAAEFMDALRAFTAVRHPATR